IRDFHVTGVQTCALPISGSSSTLRRTGASHQECRAIAATNVPAATAAVVRDALPSRHPRPAPPTAVIAQWLHHAPPATRPANEEIGRASCREGGQIEDAE